MARIFARPPNRNRQRKEMPAMSMFWAWLAQCPNWLQAAVALAIITAAAVTVTLALRQLPAVIEKITAKGPIVISVGATQSGNTTGTASSPNGAETTHDITPSEPATR